MASSSKKRTTMAKLNREQKLREKRQEKQARKDARRAEAQSTVRESHATATDMPGDDEAVEMLSVDPAGVAAPVVVEPRD